MRTFVIKEREAAKGEVLTPGGAAVVRAVSNHANLSPALTAGMKVYECPELEEHGIVFNIPHTCVTLDGTRDAASPRFYMPTEDLEEV